jgi:hypothetical protein
VTATPVNVASASVAPHLIRNYPPPRGQVATSPHGHPWQIIEAALATMATPPRFAPLPIHFQGSEFAFQDAGPFGYTNPSRLAHDEALCLFPAMHLNTFVSLGAGLPKLLHLGDASKTDPRERYMKWIVEVANGTELVHDSLAAELRKL